MAIEQLTAQRQVESLDLAGGGRGRRLGQPVGNRVVPADLVEEVSDLLCKQWLPI